MFQIIIMQISGGFNLLRDSTKFCKYFSVNEARVGIVTPVKKLEEAIHPQLCNFSSIGYCGHQIKKSSKYS